MPYGAPYEPARINRRAEAARALVARWAAAEAEAEAEAYAEPEAWAEGEDWDF